MPARITQDTVSSRRTTGATAVAAAAAAVLLAGCSDNNTTPTSTSTPAGSSPSVSASSPAGSATTSPAPSGSVAVSQDSAEQAALKTVPGGKIRSSELDRENGHQVWNVEVTDASGNDRDVDVDATTGQVLPASSGNDTSDTDSDQ
jgi:uncharacterized membrane protein YkoI